MTVTVLHTDGTTRAEGSRAEDGRLWLSASDFTAVTGWVPKPEGLCQGELCLPQPHGSSWTDADGRVDLAAFADRLRIPLVGDEEHDVWALGRTSTGIDGDGPVEAPDFALPDLDGTVHRLSDYRGKKVFLLAWASY